MPDAQRALRLVRSRAKEWGMDPERVGMLGFSAGGQLASYAAGALRRRASRTPRIRWSARARARRSRR